MTIKKTELRCPLCGENLIKARVCKDVEIQCHQCGASLLITKDEGGACNVSARPKDYGMPKPVTA